jgi:hypothetical protein
MFVFFVELVSATTLSTHLADGKKAINLSQCQLPLIETNMVKVG